jgi:hypothetical protein
LKVLVEQNISQRRAHSLDFEFLKSVVDDHSLPEFGGCNAQMSREQGHSIKPASAVFYTTLVDMVHSDPTTMMTAIVEALTLTIQTGQVFTVFTADQQLYRVMVDVMSILNCFATSFHDLGECIC